MNVADVSIIKSRHTKIAIKKYKAKIMANKKKYPKSAVHEFSTFLFHKRTTVNHSVQHTQSVFMIKQTKYANLNEHER